MYSNNKKKHEQQFLKIVNLYSPSDPAITCVGIDPRATKSYNYTKAVHECLMLIVKKSKLLKCSSMDK